MTRAPLDHDMPGGHQPVMLREVLAALNPRGGGIYVDGTFGAGGYARALLEAADCTVWGIDRDPDAIAAGKTLAERHAGRLHLVAGRFGEMAALLNARGVAASDGVALDIGVSSMQLDRAERGFSFRQDGPLDMRMERRGESAADLVNGRSEQELADIIFTFGEERRARAVARAIVAARREAPVAGTLRLAEIVRKAVGGRAAGIDPATRTFQALRIYVNDELGELDRGLIAAETLLRPGGRLAVVTFHSLEDRRVKSFLRRRSGRVPQQSRHRPQRPEPLPEPSFRLLPADGTTPSAQDVRDNPRARSARLRAAERTGAPSWPRDATEVRP
jgi:16S rRNA (cytosine1402-N4)-methyltransferase